MKRNFKRIWKLGQEEHNTQHLDASAKGELVVKEGYYQYPIRELLRKYGSPLEIVFPYIVEQRLRHLQGLFDAYIKLNDYKGRFFYHYPMKVNQGKEIVLSLVSEGANLETSSANELWIVKRLHEQGKVTPRLRVLCNGPKTLKYLNLIDELDRKGLMVTPVIEEEHELAFFRRYKGEVGIRVNLQVKINSHWDKKFNRFGFQEDDLLKMGRIRNLGVLSYHISSQIEKLEGLTAPIRRAVQLYAKMREQNPQLDTINIGGGAAVPYEKRRMYTPKAAVGLVVKTFKRAAAQLGVREPNIICEWGRYAVAPAQMTVFQVLSEKTVTNGHSKKWYTVDGSFITDLPDTWGIHQKWQIVPVNNLHSRRLQKVWLAGSTCDSDDKYTAGGGHVLLPKLEEGEDLYVAVLDTGAYQDSLANRHCLLSRPVKLIAQNGDVTVVRKRESSEEVGRKFGW
ncbi:hypothetical protein A3C96_02365 [Candidatus Uhrbacteria bacterium RIFCSPHIGHO2_02_FULL_60_10]|uniref:arginine decarboxylase n=1 Tax=Candidatus Uhrbacteria bacterium RIFCSPHIGHO2_02_FULL_60_10 TaxID=1802392 RepID=A0A1F7U7P9_9BACT|nr:MAG: hypothetical protein A3C96_02365 [Candidatus Uhrbacteria bacterium RIFCSPHIGHO2_02_FULL_60_10]